MMKQLLPHFSWFGLLMLCMGLGLADRSGEQPGAIGTLAAAEVIKQRADGHTIFGVALPTSAAPASGSKT